MSHIPASAMPHSKPHDDEPARPAHDDQPLAVKATLPAGDKPAPRPELAPGVPLGSVPGVPAKGPGKRPGPGSATPFVAIATVAAVAVGGIVAALALRKGEQKPAKGKRKDGRKAKTA